jgi:S1-C subfamily serine protease
MINLWFKKEDVSQTISSLDDFIRQFETPVVGINESIKNLEEGLIEIVQYGSHSYNGLLITNDGYFLTIKHGIKNRSGQKIRLPNGKKYPIQKVCIYTDDDDIALVKAAIPNKSSSREYLFYDTNNLESGMAVALLTRRKGKIERTYGFIGRRYSFVHTESGYYPEHFSMLLESKPGDSGGLIVSPDGKLIGFDTSAAFPARSSAVKYNRALELIKYYKKCLENKQAH